MPFKTSFDFSAIPEPTPIEAVNTGSGMQAEAPAERKAAASEVAPQSLPERTYPPSMTVEDEVGVALAFHYMGGGAPVPYKYPIVELEEKTLPPRYQGGNRAMKAGLIAAKFPGGTVCVLETADGKFWWYPTKRGIALARECLI